MALTSLDILIMLLSCYEKSLLALKIQVNHDIFLLGRWLQSQMVASLLNYNKLLNYPPCTHSLICTVHSCKYTHKPECVQKRRCLNECCHCGESLLIYFQILLPSIRITAFVSFISLWCLMFIFCCNWVQFSDWMYTLGSYFLKKGFPAED